MRREPLPSGLLHPVALAAIGILIINDHILKTRYPGWVTGKLSDLAGLVFFPLLLRALLAPVLRDTREATDDGALRLAHGRLLIACAAMTALAFAAIKLAAPATAAGEQILGALQGGRAAIVRDPTDLVALPCVLGALWIARRVDARA